MALVLKGGCWQAHGIEKADITHYADSFEALASAKAVVDSFLLILDRRDFLEVAGDEPDACKALDAFARRCA